MDIQQEIEQAVGHGPSLPAPEQRLAAGRAALRRRRIVVGSTVVMVGAVMVTPFALAAGGGRQAVEPAPATPPAATRAPAPEPTEAATEDPAPPQRWLRWETIRYTAAGELEIRPGVEVLDRVDDHLGGSPRWEHSVAMEVRYQGTVHWVSAEWSRDGSSGSGSTEANDGWADFRAWVASQAAANLPGSGDPGNGYPELVVAGEGNTLVAAPGATILEQQASPDLPENFAPASAQTAAAYVERDGTRYLVLTRPGDVITVPSAGHGSSLGELLAWAKQRYESGEGLL